MQKIVMMVPHSVDSYFHFLMVWVETTNNDPCRLQGNSAATFILCVLELMYTYFHPNHHLYVTLCLKLTKLQPFHNINNITYFKSPKLHSCHVVRCRVNSTIPQSKSVFVKLVLYSQSRAAMCRMKNTLHAL